MKVENGMAGIGGGRTDVAAPAATPAASAFPCLNSNNSNESPLPAGIVEGLNSLSTNHRKTAYKLAKSVARLCGKYGIERVGFLTLTFADHVTCAREAGKRFNSLSTGVLRGRYVETICVLERMESGRVHFHLLVVLAADIRTGFDFAAAERGDYRSANKCLRAEWAFWRETAKDYGFGRCELLPVKSNEDGISKYVGKYIAKHVGQREERDKGVRLVRYSRGASIGSNAFMFVSPRSRLWREQVAIFAQRNGCADLDELRVKLGSKWAYHHRGNIMAIEPPAGVSVARDSDSGEILTLQDVWMADRLRICQQVAASGYCSEAEAFTYLWTQARSDLSFVVPKWEGQTCRNRNSDTQARDDSGDVTLVMWNPEDLNQVRIIRRDSRE